MTTAADDVADFIDPEVTDATPAVVAGHECYGLYDSSAVLEADNGVVTRAPTLRLASADATASGVAAGSAVTAGGYAHKVRQVIALPPDGAMTQLVLART